MEILANALVKLSISLVGNKYLFPVMPELAVFFNVGLRNGLLPAQHQTFC